MPISSRDFEKSDREPGSVLVEFLRSHSLEAYSADELSRELASQGVKLSDEELANMLMLMEYGRKITSRKIGEVTYYRYHQYSASSP